MGSKTQVQPIRRSALGPVNCDDIDRSALITLLGGPPKAEGEVVMNLNAHALNLTLKDTTVAAAFRSADLVFCDGFGCLLLNRIFGTVRLHNRNTPPDFVAEVYRRLADIGGTVFFVGDEDANVSAYARKIEDQYPGIVAGWNCGFFLSGSDEEKTLLEAITSARPALLLVGMGMPRQELWIARHRNRLRGIRVLTVGALFSWGTTARRRGPRWATDRGLEWFFRLLLEPKRVWRRYLIGLPEVVVRMVAFSIRRRSGASM